MSSLNPGAAEGGEGLALEAIAEGAVIELEASVDGEPESLVVHRDVHGVRAWRNICPHAGRRLDYAPGQFLRTKDGALMCAVHGATFDLADGRCVAGPCRGQALAPVALEVRDGRVHVKGPA